MDIDPISFVIVVGLSIVFIGVAVIALLTTEKADSKMLECLYKTTIEEEVDRLAKASSEAKKVSDLHQQWLTAVSNKTIWRTTAIAALIIALIAVAFQQPFVISTIRTTRFFAFFVILIVSYTVIYAVRTYDSTHSIRPGGWRWCKNQL